MPHDVTLISTLAIGFALAFAFGFVANRFRLPPLVGYLVAGVFMGRFGQGVVGDSELTGQLAEIGVMLLMFGVGLHFSVGDLMAVRRIAIPGAIGQIVLATLIGVGMTKLWGWTLGAGLVFGLSLSVASTVVLLKALEERSAVATPNGRIAIGWLIVEDLAMVVALVLLPAFAETLGGHSAAGPHGPPGGNLWAALALTLGKVAAFVVLALLVGPRVMPWILRQVARTGSRELFTLSVLAIALGLAFGSAKLFGVSFALGAFFAGVVLNESDLSHKAAANSMPLQDAFAVLFFVSVGMLFDPRIILQQPWMILGTLALVLVGKSLVALGIVVAMGYPLGTALVVSASLAQIGEFSFILAGLGIAHGLFSVEGQNLILAGAIISISLNPLVFAVADRATAWASRRPGLKARFEEGARGARFARLQGELDTAREAAETKARAHATFTPEALASRFPLFTGLTPDQREVLVLHFHAREAKPGERLIRAGDRADVVYFISAGEVEVAVGARRIRLGPGDYFGEMAIISGQPRSADVTALDYCKFVTLSQKDLRKFLRRYPSIREQMSAIAARRGEMNRQFLDEIERETAAPPGAEPPEGAPPR
jgi:CPA2 family monovalent cation:H+ antiporter-2